MIIEGHPAREFIDYIPRNNKHLVVIGDHPDKWEDILMVELVIPYYDTMAINSAADGAYTDYCCTLHSAELGQHCFPTDSIDEKTIVIGNSANGLENPRVDHVISAEPLGGTSALFATVVGMILGYDKIILTGVRLEPGTIYYDEHVESNWRKWKPIFGNRVHAMGKSWLQDLLWES